jgi:hypothetical protein
MKAKLPFKTKVPQATLSDTVTMKCHGPGIVPGSKKCIPSQSPKAEGWLKIGCHEVSRKLVSYTGIRAWRCPVCFDEHRKKLAHRMDEINLR